MTRASALTAIANTAIAVALDHLLKEIERDPAVEAYAWSAQPGHYLAADQIENAMAAMHRLSTRTRPLASRDLWLRHLPQIRERLDIHHPFVSEARRNVAIWRSHAGEAATAVSEFSDLIAEITPLLGPDHAYLLPIRAAQAGARISTGDYLGAIEEYETVIPLMVRALGPESRDVFAARSGLAAARGEAGLAHGLVLTLDGGGWGCRWGGRCLRRTPTRAKAIARSGAPRHPHYMGQCRHVEVPRRPGRAAGRR